MAVDLNKQERETKGTQTEEKSKEVRNYIGDQSYEEASQTCIE